MPTFPVSAVLGSTYASPMPWSCGSFSGVCTDCRHCASHAAVFTPTLGSDVSSAFCCFPGKDFYKKHAQHEGGSRCRLTLHTPLQFLAYGGWLKKMDLNGVKIYSSCITENKLFLFGHMLHVVLAAPACAVMKECFRFTGCTDQSNPLCWVSAWQKLNIGIQLLFCMNHTFWLCLYLSLKESKLNLWLKRTENPMQL